MPPTKLGPCLHAPGLEWHREKHFKHATLRAVAELVYHAETGGTDPRLGSWFSRRRAAATRTYERHRRSLSLCSSRRETSSVEDSRRKTSTQAVTPPEERKDIRTSTKGRTANPRSSSVSAELVKPMRSMQMRDHFEITPEATFGTVIYLSPHYKQLLASGIAGDTIRNNMYDELSAQFGALGVTLTSDVNATFAADQRSLVLLMLCPGFFGCSDLVEEMARALAAVRRQRKHPVASGRILHSEANLLLNGDSLTKRTSSLRPLGTFSKPTPKAVVPLLSSAMSYDEYLRACPPDLKALGIFEFHFDKWPEAVSLQPTAVKIAISRLPAHHHSTRYGHNRGLLRRLQHGRCDTAVEASIAVEASNTAVAVNVSRLSAMPVTSQRPGGASSSTAAVGTGDAAQRLATLRRNPSLTRMASKGNIPLPPSGMLPALSDDEALNDPARAQSLRLKNALAVKLSTTRIVELVRTPLGFGLRLNSQYRVVGIAHGSQAERCGGFAVHDQLVSLNGQPLSGSASIEERLRGIEVGAKVSFEIDNTA